MIVAVIVPPVDDAPPALLTLRPNGPQPGLLEDIQCEERLVPRT